MPKLPNAAPKPRRKPKKARAQLKRGRVKPVKKRNDARRKKEFARTYGSMERVAFIQRQPCVVCGWTGGCENAHIKTGGVGRKSDARFIVPLCGSRPWNQQGAAILDARGWEIGCHKALHDMGRRLFEKAYFIDLDVKAADTHARWLASSPQQDDAQ